MTDAFTQAVAREVAQLMTQQGQQFTQFSPASGTAGFQLEPQHVLQVMQGNSQWLNQFETELEDSFRRIADKSLDYWLKQTDPEIRESLRALSKIAEMLLETSLSGSSGNSAKLDASLANVAGTATTALLESFFDRERITSSESERSRGTASRYKASRGQTQARLSRELSRGKRYT